MADFEPKATVARAYGVHRRHDGTAERALFVIDAEGVIRWSYVSPVGGESGALANNLTASDEVIEQMKESGRD